MSEKELQKIKKTYYKEHYTSFVRNENNLRKDLRYDKLKSAIVALQGVTDCVFVLPEKTEEGKRVILEGNRRHLILEELIEIERNQDVSPLIPFILLPKEVLEDELEQIKYQLAYGDIDKSLKPVEYWRGIQRQSEIILNRAQEGDPKYAHLKDKPNAATKVLQDIARSLGVSRQWVSYIYNVFKQGTSLLLEWLESSYISIYAAGKAISIAKNLASNFNQDFNIVLDDLLRQAQVCSTTYSLSKISEKYLLEAETLLIANFEKDTSSNEVSDSGEAVEGGDSEEGDEVLPNSQVSIEKMRDDLKDMMEFVLMDISKLEDKEIKKCYFFLIDLLDKSKIKKK